MYGSVEVPLVGMKPEERKPLVNVSGSGRNAPDFLEDLDPSDKDFWRDVKDRYKDANSNVGREDVSYSQCLDEVRAERIKKKYDQYDEGGKDPVVLMMTDWYDQFKEYESKTELIPVFEKQISKLAEILIDKEYARAKKERDDPRYSEWVFTDDNGTEKSLLHLAAERNFVDIAKCLLQHKAELVYLKTMGDDKMPIESALENYQDDVAALIIKAMSNKRRVRELFEYTNDDEDEDEEQKDLHEDKLNNPRFRFKTFVDRADMKKTVIAILDCLINPDWPYTPVEEKKDADEMWSKMPDVPIRYHFYYRILDGDECGRPAKIKYTQDDGVEVEILNPRFNHKEKSCLQSLCESEHSEMAFRHPVVRQLARRKWDNFGRFRVRMYAFIYLAYLLLLSIAFLGAVHSTDPTKYKKPFDYFRGLCEVLTLAMVIFYLCSEFDQMEKERTHYWWDPFNWLDLIGLIGIIIIVPLRFGEVKYQWHVSAIIYLVNFFRIFKFFPAWKDIGIYSKTLQVLIKTDLKLFSVVYVVVFFAFSGGTFLSLRGATKYNATTGFDNVKVSGFKDILLRQARALAESNPFNDSYNGFDPLSVIIILVNMLVVMVILVNILIAQLSSTYDSAKDNAVLQYDIDRTIFVTRLENSRFTSINKRMEYYQDGDFVNEKELVKELLSHWDDLHPEETKEQQLKEFRANVISGKTEEEHGQSHHHPEEHLKEDLRHQISDQLKDEQRQISQRLDSLEMILSDKFKGQSDLLKKEQKHSEKQLSERLDSLEMILKDKLKHQSDRLEEEQKKMSQRLESLETILLDIKSRL